ncbi:hypothetical protein GCM10023188_16210 [Pontibacter saemangeumensis]|uniref:DUF4145 domain-containing protein n=1 Tax=Pontibacter saemangeumensis TaxID=1084525 RepID=A0ABP8LKM8_9BACT
MIEKDILLDNLSKIEHLTFRCECCKKGVKLLDQSKYFESESEFSRSEFTEEVNGFKTKIHRRFSAGFICSNPECGDISIFVGDKNSVLKLEEGICQGKVTQFPVHHDKITIYDIIPTLNLFDIKSYSFKAEASALEGELEEAFSIFWRNADCCGMKIRSVLEVVMDDNGIDKTHIPMSGKNKGKVTTYNLYERIELFHDKYPNEDLKAVLNNLRKLGNIGSHPRENLTREKLVFMLETLECILNQLYTDNRKKLVELDKKLIEFMTNTQFN